MHDPWFCALFGCVACHATADAQVEPPARQLSHRGLHNRVRIRLEPKNLSQVKGPEFPRAPALHRSGQRDLDEQRPRRDIGPRHHVIDEYRLGLETETPLPGPNACVGQPGIQAPQRRMSLLLHSRSSGQRHVRVYPELLTLPWVVGKRRVPRIRGLKALPMHG